MPHSDTQRPRHEGEVDKVYLDPRVLLLVPGVMAVYDCAYCLGFLVGVFKATGRGSSEETRYGFFAELTR